MRIKIENCTPEEVVFLSNAALNGRDAVFSFTAKVLEVDYSVAACVKSGEFPEKMLEYIKPEYVGMVEIILHREDYEALFNDRRKQLRLQLREIDSDQSRTLEERVEAQQRLVYGDKYDAMKMVIQ